MLGTSREMILSMEVYIIWKRFGAILNVLQKALDKDLHWKPEMKGSWLVCVAGSAHFYLHRVFLAPYLKETKHSESAWNKGMQDVCVVYLQSSLNGPCMHLYGQKVWVPVLMQRKEEVQNIKS